MPLCLPCCSFLPSSLLCRSLLCRSPRPRLPPPHCTGWLLGPSLLALLLTLLALFLTHLSCVHQCSASCLAVPTYLSLTCPAAAPGFVFCAVYAGEDASTSPHPPLLFPRSLAFFFFSTFSSSHPPFFASTLICRGGPCLVSLLLLPFVSLYRLLCDFMEC